MYVGFCFYYYVYIGRKLTSIVLFLPYQNLQRVIIDLQITALI